MTCCSYTDTPQTRLQTDRHHLLRHLHLPRPTHVLHPIQAPRSLQAPPSPQTRRSQPHILQHLPRRLHPSRRPLHHCRPTTHLYGDQSTPNFLTSTRLGRSYLLLHSILIGRKRRLRGRGRLWLGIKAMRMEGWGLVRLSWVGILRLGVIAIGSSRRRLRRDI